MITGPTLPVTSNRSTFGPPGFTATPGISGNCGRRSAEHDLGRVRAQMAQFRQRPLVHQPSLLEDADPVAGRFHLAEDVYPARCPAAAAAGPAPPGATAAPTSTHPATPSVTPTRRTDNAAKPARRSQTRVLRQCSAPWAWLWYMSFSPVLARRIALCRRCTPPAVAETFQHRRSHPPIATAAAALRHLVIWPVRAVKPF